jgi:predicted Zn-dependent protease
MQHMPNLALMPNPASVRLEDLVADVKDGILVEQGVVGNVDFQAKNGLLGGQMREIRNGRLGRGLVKGAVLFNTPELWKHLSALGGSVTQATVGSARFTGDGDEKGQPRQSTSYSVSAVAATLLNQPVIDPARKA